jgi:hypothetical protein
MLKVARSIYGHDDSDDEDVDEVDHDCGGKGDNGKRLGDYNAYTDIDEVGREFNRRNMLISVVALEQDQRFAVILRGGTSLVYLRREEFQKIVCGAIYFGWSLASTPTEYSGGLQISNHCHLLPLDAVSKGNDEEIYYLIPSTWKEMLEDGTVDLSRVLDAMYS